MADTGNDTVQVCDSVPDCEDGSDEMEHCHCYLRGMFACRWVEEALGGAGVVSCRLTGQCLAKQRVCDGLVSWWIYSVIMG